MGINIHFSILMKSKHKQVLNEAKKGWQNQGQPTEDSLRIAVARILRLHGMIKL